MAIAEERERDGAMPTTMPTLTRSRSSATGAATVKSAPNPVTAPTPAPTGVDMLDQDQRPTAREMLDAADDRGLDVTIGGDAPSYYDEYDEPLDPPEHSFLTSPHGQSRGIPSLNGTRDSGTASGWRLTVSLASGTSPALVSMFTAAFLSRSLTIPQCRQRYTRSFNPIGGLAISPHSEQVCVVYAGLTGMNYRSCGRTATSLRP
jgi:hypothetical protein